MAERARSYPEKPLLWKASKSPRRTDALLLDTYAWIWTLHDRRAQMSNGAWRHIDLAARERRLFVSDISYWEVSLKAAKGQLTLPMHSTLWLGQAAGAPGIQGLATTRDLFIQSTLLAGETHADPADRMLIAHAQLSNLSLLTCDARIIDDASRQPGVPVCDAQC